jgi:DNA mismatch endonuclease (patch repair protein)
MADVMTKARRSALMARIRGKGNVSTEIALVRAFRAAGIVGWRRHWPVAGHPDFAFPRNRVAVFVDGCFWHGCPKHFSPPSSNALFWRRKIGQNRYRDRCVILELRKRGWHVVRIWEHALRKKDLPIALARIIRALGKN